MACRTLDFLSAIKNFVERGIFTKLKKLSCFFMLLLFSNFALAGGGLPANSVDKVAFQSVGFFLYADDWPNPNGCTRSDAIVLLSTDSNYDKAYALLLAAFMAGKQVSGYSDGCVDFDGQTYNTIRGFKYLVVH